MPVLIRITRTLTVLVLLATLFTTTSSRADDAATTGSGERRRSLAARVLDPLGLFERKKSESTGRDPFEQLNVPPVEKPKPQVMGTYPASPAVTPPAAPESPVYRDMTTSGQFFDSGAAVPSQFETSSEGGEQQRRLAEHFRKPDARQPEAVDVDPYHRATTTQTAVPADPDLPSRPYPWPNPIDSASRYGESHAAMSPESARPVPDHVSPHASGNVVRPAEEVKANVSAAPRKTATERTRWQDLPPARMPVPYDPEFDRLKEQRNATHSPQTYQPVERDIAIEERATSTAPDDVQRADLRTLSDSSSEPQPSEAIEQWPEHIPPDESQVQQAQGVRDNPWQNYTSPPPSSGADYGQPYVPPAPAVNRQHDGGIDPLYPSTGRISPENVRTVPTNPRPPLDGPPLDRRPLDRALPDDTAGQRRVDTFPYTEQSRVQMNPAEPQASATYSSSPVPGFGQLDKASRVLAVVGNQSILAGDVLGQINELLQPYEGKASPEQLDQQREILMRQLVPKVVENLLVYNDFLRLIPPDKMPDIDRQVNEQFDEMEVPRMIEAANVKTPADLDAKLRELGSSMAKRRRMFKEQLLAQQMVQRNVDRNPNITHDELLRYYYDHAADYEMKARVKWERLMVRFDRFPTRGQAYQALQVMGDDVEVRKIPLAAVAKRSSQGPNAAEGGQYDWTTQGSLASRVIDEILFTLPEGRLSKIVEDSDGYHIVRVIERSPAGRRSFEEVQKEIAEVIKRERIQKQVTDYLEKLRRETRVWTIYDQQ